MNRPYVNRGYVNRGYVNRGYVNRGYVNAGTCTAGAGVSSLSKRGADLHRLSDDYRWEEWFPRDTGRNLLSRRALLNPSRLIDAKEMSALGH